MKRRRQYQWIAVIASVLLVSMVLSAVLYAQSAEDIEAELQYASPKDNAPQALSALTLFETLFESVPTEAERSYLLELSDLTLSYSATQAVLGNGISTFFDKENNALEVSVSAYTYTARNGKKVEWIPQSVRLFVDGTPINHALEQSNNGYYTVFEKIYRSGELDMEVNFAWSETITREVAEAILNDAYRAGKDALDIILSDEMIQADYDARYAAFVAYEEYLQKQASYDAYSEALRFFQEIASPAYQSYQSSYQAFAADTEAYEEWQRYFDMINSGTTFEDYVAYQNYLLRMDRMKQRLNVLEVLFIKDSHGWDFYDSLMGGSVTAALLGNKSELELAGFGKQVQAAEESTVELRRLMQGYSDLRDAEYASEHDKTVALYTYYLNNYSVLRDNFKKLSAALYDFLRSPSVCIGIKEKGGEMRFAHYEQFVALLYTTSTALDDGVKRPDTWSGYSKNYTALLDVEILVADTNNATPAAADIPEAEVPYVEWMDSPPTLPQISKKPIFENYLSADVKAYLAEHGKNSLDEAPKAPDPVEDPSQGEIPPAATHPGNAPVPTEMDSRLRALAEEVRIGTLKIRTLGDYNATLHLEKTVERPVSIDNKKVVIFYAHDGQTVLDRQVVEYGQSFIYQGSDAVYHREQSASHTYEYLGWFLADGETRAEMVATSDLSLYAKYKEKIRFYTVTWILDGIISPQEVEYGTMPTCPFQTEKAPDEGYTYSFSGWRAEGMDEIGVGEVTGNVTYVGSITKTPKLYTVTWQLGDRTEQIQVPYGEYPIYNETPQRAPDRYAYTFLKWNKPLEWVRADATYTAEWERIGLAQSIDGDLMEIVHTDTAVTVIATHEQIDLREAAKLAQASGKALAVRWDRLLVTVENSELTKLTETRCRRMHLLSRTQTSEGMAYTFGYFNSAGQEMATDIRATVSGIAADGEMPLSGAILVDGVWQSVGTAAVTVTGSASFRIGNSYCIEVVGGEKCNLSSFPEYVGVGTRVDLRLGCVFGYEVAAIKVTLEDGTEVATEGLSFLMPSGNVRVELTVTPIIYHITFVADGKVIAEADYLLGEKIVLPTVPAKPSDASYDYTFVGWSQDITVAYGEDRNPVYEAVFSVTPIEVDHHKMSTIDVVVLIVLPIVGGLALIGVGVLIALRVIKKKKASVSAMVTATEQKTEKAVDGESMEEVSKENSSQL